MERVLALVCEPWQTKAMARLLNHLENAMNCGAISMGVMDYYQMVHNLDTFENIQLPKITKIHSQDDLYRSWQSKFEDPELLGRIDLKIWESVNCKDRTLEEIELGNQLVRPWERDQYVLPISDYWKKRVLEDTILWCENYFQTFKPSIVISIERFELANSIFYQICKREKIPMLTFIGSRVGNRWILRDDFGYGCSVDTESKIEIDGQLLEYQSAAQELIDSIRWDNVGSYASDSRILVSKVEKNKFSLFMQLIRDLRKLAGNIYARHLIEPKNYALKVYRFEENHYKLTIYLIRRLFIRYMSAFGIKSWGKKEFPKSPYIVWALHYRPETSGLVLGDGRDEIAELERIAELLPNGWVLAVKENPLMLGERRRGFYRGLAMHSNIQIIDSSVNTIELVKASRGVVGISGTILLEAAAIGIPACALGNPEFVKCLSYTGWNVFSDFISDIEKGKTIDDSRKVKKYIAYVLANSHSSDVRYLSDEKNAKFDQMMHRFGNEVSKYIDKYRSRLPNSSHDQE